jgi:outer membrane protein
MFRLKELAMNPQVFLSSLRSLLCAAAMVSVQAWAQSPVTEGFKGDAGAMVVASRSVVQGGSTEQVLRPYVYGDWGRFLARVDTLGMRLVPLGQGSLELLARASTEGFKASGTARAGLVDRSTPLPLGLGTFQRTDLGAYWLYALHDTRSSGQLVELTWAGRIPAGPLTLYPQLGLEYRSAAYVQHLYGVSAAEARASGLAAYTPQASVVPVATLQATWPLGGAWSLQTQARYRHWDGPVRHSPLVQDAGQWSGLLALTRSWP